MSNSKPEERHQGTASNTILEQLEFDIHALETDPASSHSAYLLIDGDLRIREYDSAAASIFGLSHSREQPLAECCAIGSTQMKRLLSYIEAILNNPDETDEQFLRLELRRDNTIDAFCLTLAPRLSEKEEVEVVCKLEPILNRTPQSNIAKPLRKPLANGIDLWSMDGKDLNFNCLPSLQTPKGEDSTPPARTHNLQEWLSRVCQEDKREFRDGIQKLLDGKSDSFHLRYRFRSDDGELKWVSTIARRNESHEELENGFSIVGLHREEREIPNIVDDLRLFSHLAKKVQLAIVVTNRHGNATWCNNAFTDISGYTLDDIMDRNPTDLLQGPLSDHKATSHMRDRIKRGKAFHAELVNYKKNGVPFWTRIDANPLVDENGKFVRYIAFLTDITESKQSQNAIIRSEIKFRSLFDNSIDALLLVSPKDGNIIEANRAAIDFFGESRLVGQKLDEIFPDSNVFKIEQLNEIVELSDEPNRETGEFVRPNGKRQPVEMTVSRTPIGDSVALFVTLRDISEKRLLEEQLRHAQRMEAVGRLAGGIAHDFNNLLAGLRGFSELLCNSKDLSERDHVYALEVLKITDRASKLTNRLLSFSRGKSDRPVVTNLNDIVGNLTPMLSRILKKDIQFTSKLDPSIKNVKVDPNQIEQVVMNLVVNGQEAINGSEGKVELDTSSERLDGTEIFVTGKAKAGLYSTVSVRDNGQGIPPDVMEKVFEPFFTTKKGAGTGLGLSIVYGIIQSNGGHIMARSEIGQGTEFTFYFPTVSEMVWESVAPDSHLSLPSNPSASDPETKTILLAEDQDQVREILELGLGQRGYNLLVASDGKSAIDLARNREGGIDMLLTDSIMPRASGCHVINEVRKMYPDIKVILMSGLPQSESEDCQNVEVDAYVDKPFSIRGLIQQIERILAAEVSST